MIDFLIDWLENHIKITISSIVIIFILIISISIILINRENNEWEIFKISHNCKIISKEKGSTSIGISSDGKSTTTIVIPDKTGWLCDDGITYIR